MCAGINISRKFDMFGRFNADRVTSGIAKLKSARKNVSQKRMDR